MSGIGIQITDEGFDQAIGAIEGIEQLDQGETLDALGQLFVQSTRERIEVTKTSPDGAAWQKNNAGTSTLYDSGNLSGSIDYQVGGSSLAIGSALIYAAIHQMGGVIKPIKAKRLAFMIGRSIGFCHQGDNSRKALFGCFR